MVCKGEHGCRSYWTKVLSSDRQKTTCNMYENDSHRSSGSRLPFVTRIHQDEITSESQCHITMPNENQAACVSSFSYDASRWHILKFPVNILMPTERRHREEIYFLPSDSPVSIDHRFRRLKRVQLQYTRRNKSGHPQRFGRKLRFRFERWPIDSWWDVAKIICVICV